MWWESHESSGPQHNTNCQQQQHGEGCWLLWWRGSYMRYWGSNIENTEWDRDTHSLGWRLLLSITWVNSVKTLKEVKARISWNEIRFFTETESLCAWSIISVSMISLYTWILLGFDTRGLTRHDFSKVMIFYVYGLTLFLAWMSRTYCCVKLTTFKRRCCCKIKFPPSVFWKLFSRLMSMFILKPFQMSQHENH